MTRWVGRPLKLPPETVQALLVWAALGTSIPKVARNLGVDPKTVRNYVKQKQKRSAA